MKKKIELVLLFLVFILTCITIYKANIKEHHVTYKIGKYTVEENYQKKPTDYYQITIKKGKHIYSYSLKQNLKKQKEILQDIKEFKKGTLNCIVPIYKKEVEETLLCREDNQQVSLDYLVKENHSNFQTIQKKTEDYNIQYPSSSDVKTKYKSITVYNKNIAENQFYYIWNYKGLYVFTFSENKYEEMLDYDLYDNLLACTIKDRFVLLENNSVNGIKNIYYYDTKKQKIRIAKLKDNLSKDSYINGIKDNLIYITDRKQKRQYTLDVWKEQLVEIDEDETSYITYQKGKKKELSKSDFFLDTQLFEDSSTGTIVHDNITYYKEGDKIYKSYSKDNPILLLELENIKEWQIKNDNIIILKDDSIYSYNDKNGLRPILEDKELLYNYKSIYHLGEI